jgi:hypothetical protein
MKSRLQKIRLGIIFLGLVTAVFAIGLIILPPRAPGVSRDVAIRALVGEASDQGLKGMVCVGEVLRRRGSIKGFVGYWSAHLKDEPQWAWRMARAAWAMSEYTHLTKGANHFYDTRAPERPSWTPDCPKVYEYRNHIFCKELPPNLRPR